MLDKKYFNKALESEAALTYVLGTAGVLAGSSFLYYYWVKRLKSESIPDKKSKNLSENPNEDNQESKNDVTMEFNEPV